MPFLSTLTQLYEKCTSYLRTRVRVQRVLEKHHKQRVAVVDVIHEVFPPTKTKQTAKKLS